MVRAGAFRNCLTQDVRCLLNHSANHILGRTKSGTLELREDDVGLRFFCSLPDTSYAADLVQAIKRGDVSQCSFGFIVGRDGQRWTDREGLPLLRELLSIETLVDVSPVTFPAYTGTSVDVRSLFPDGLPAEVRARRTGERLEGGIYRVPTLSDDLWRARAEMKNRLVMLQ